MDLERSGEEGVVHVAMHPVCQVRKRRGEEEEARGRGRGEGGEGGGGEGGEGGGGGGHRSNMICSLLFIILDEHFTDDED